jgi:hypothetical protein
LAASRSSLRGWNVFAELVMCEKCREIDKKIEVYQRLIQATTDQGEIESLREKVKHLIWQKLDLHTIR